MDTKQLEILDQKLLAYSTAAVAALMLSATNADAATIIYDNGGSGWQNAVGPGPILSWDRLGQVDIQGSSPSTNRIQFLYTTSNNKLYLSAFGTGRFNPYRLTASNFIGPGTAQLNPDQEIFATLHDATFGWDYGWSAGSRGYLAFKFDNGTPQGSDDYFGWADITTHAPDEISLHRLGISDTGGEAVHTPVPEPSSILLLASGAAGLAAMRRRKKEPKAA